MGCAPSKNVDLASEVSLYHFNLHRVVGKGAFGKVRHLPFLSLPGAYPPVLRSASLNIKRAKNSMLSSTWTSSNVSERRPWPMSFRNGDYSRRCGASSHS